MERFLVFVIICSLGGAYGRVVRRDAPAQAMDSSQGLTNLASQLMTLAAQYQPQQSTSGDQPNYDANGAGAMLQNAFKSWFPYTQNQPDGEVMNYDLSQAMQAINQSQGIIPRIDNTDTSSMSREEFLRHVQKQTNSFSNILNSNMALYLKPDRVAKYMNLTSRYGNTALTPEDEMALQVEYQNMMTDFQKDLEQTLNNNQPNRAADTVPSVPSASSLKDLQNQMTSLAAMYNRELNQALQPRTVQAGLSGSQLDTVSQDLGKAVMNIFQSINQGSGPFNSKLHWDSNNNKQVQY